MENENPKGNTKTDFKNWLEQLQQQSWELELLISGFSIFLLVQTGEPIQKFEYYLDYHLSSSIYLASIKILLGVLTLGRTFLIFNLILHVMLRGLWIATLGLRYVSGELEVDQLRYSKRFTSYLKRRMPDFDDYIEFLEKICSLIFAFTFVIIFAALSAALFLVYFILFSYIMTRSMYLASDSFFVDIISVFLAVVLMLFIVILLIYFIDFITFGWVKRFEGFSVVYLPVYKILGYLSLSFLYRPLIYNMIDNRFGRRVGYLMVPYIAVGFILASIHFELNFFKPKEYVGDQAIEIHSYDDMIDKMGQQLQHVSIPSRHIKDDYLEIFFRIKPKKDEKTMEYLCPDYKAVRKSGMLIGDFVISMNVRDTQSIEQDQEAGLQCWQQMYSLRLDSLDISDQVDYHYYMHPQYKLDGILGILDIHHLERGKHILRITKQRISSNPFNIEMGKEPTLDTVSYDAIPFWK